MTNSFCLTWLPRWRNILESVVHALPSKLGPLESIVATHPLGLVHLDYLYLEPRKGLEENVLVVTDHFTRYAQVYVTQTAHTTAKTLWDQVIFHYGLPEKILSDQGWNFESQLLADLCKLIGMQKIWTSPYYPQTNSSTPPWLACWECYPQRRNQSGRTALQC